MSRTAAVLFITWLGLTVAMAAPQAGPHPDYAARREALRARLNDGLVVLFGNGEPAGSEAFHVFHQESNFLYLTGYDSPGAILVLSARRAPRRRTGTDNAPTEILFLPPRDPQAEVWTGPQLDPARPETARALGFESVRSAKEFAAEIRKLARETRKIYAKLPGSQASDDESAPDRARLERLKKSSGVSTVMDVRPLLTALRQVKSPQEISLIRKAVDCSMKAHFEAGRALQPGLYEYEIAALMKYTMERAGCTITGFDPIVAAGPRSTILHYTRSAGRMEAGDLVVLDVGGEYQDYSADVSRTLPVSGKFTPRQREIYEIVLGAQEAVLKAVRPGMMLYTRGRESLHGIAYDYLNTHGTDRHGQPLGKYFTHGIGHSVGLDVHDAQDRASALQEGMVLAIEPGLYLPEENIGVRIEDMVLITRDGAEILTRELPRSVEEVERWMQE